MVSNTWIYDLDSKVFALLKSRAISKLKTEYPDINFVTTDNNTSTSASFPCVYFHVLPGAELGNDMENTSINAVLYSIQIEVYTDKSQSDARKVMTVLIDILKGMNFSIIQMPEFKNINTVYRNVARARRVVGAGDIL